jgi:signal transduction histidine kinase
MKAYLIQGRAPRRIIMLRRIFVRCAFLIILLIVVVVPAFEILVVQPSYLNFLIEKTEEHAAHYARDLALELDFEQHNISQVVETKTFSDKLKNLEVQAHLLKLRVFSAAGEIVFSTMSNEIGNLNTKAYFHKIVARGQVYSKVVFEDELSAEGQAVPVTVVETYYPITQNGVFIGAFELYYDISRDVAAIRDVNRSSTYNIIGVCLLLTAVMLGALILVRRNIEQRLAVEERLRELATADEIDHQKSEFIAMIAHELQTPLTAIIGYSELLDELDEADLDFNQRKEYLGYIRDRGEALSRLISDLLDSTLIDSGQALAIDFRLQRLDKLVRTHLSQLRLPSDKFTLNVDLTNTPVLVKADDGRIIQVLDNLLSNAIKYSPQGGTLRVTVSTYNGECQVTVADQGCGMTPEQLEHIFSPFYRTETARNSVRGIGLGLSIVKHIIDAHGGTLAAISEVDRGTSVTFTLPVIES